MKTDENLISFSFTTSFDEEKVKIRNDGWCDQEKEEALKHNINLKDYKIVKVTHGLCERGKVSRDLLAAFDGYEIIITLKTNSKFKTGNKVKIINYGHLLWENKEQYHLRNGNHAIPENLIGESQNNYWIDIRPEIVNKEDVIEKVILTQKIYQYSLVKNGAWFSENQLELII